MTGTVLTRGDKLFRLILFDTRWLTKATFPLVCVSAGEDCIHLFADLTVGHFLLSECCVDLMETRDRLAG